MSECQPLLATFGWFILQHHFARGEAREKCRSIESHVRWIHPWDTDADESGKLGAATGGYRSVVDAT